MKLKIIFVSVLYLLIFTGCYKEIDLEKYRPVPKYVLNCGISPDSIITASITRTWFFTDQFPNLTLKDIKVDVFVNDEFKQQMWWEDNKEAGRGYNSEGIYVSSVIPKAGDHVKIVGSGEFGTIVAEEIIPFPAGLERVELFYQDNDENFGEITYKITLKDPGETIDYYLVKVVSEGGDAYSYGYYYTVDWGKEPLVRPNVSALDQSLKDIWINGYGGVVFSDELINGKEYTLTGTERWSKNIYISQEQEVEDILPITRSVYIYKISQTYYQYLNLLQYYWSTLQSDLADAGLAEPIRIPTNVQGGTGILGGYNPGEPIILNLTDRLPYQIIKREWDY